MDSTSNFSVPWRPSFWLAKRLGKVNLGNSSYLTHYNNLILNALTISSLFYAITAHYSQTMSLQWSAINTKTQKQPYLRLILFQLLSNGLYLSENTFLFSKEP